MMSGTNKRYKGKTIRKERIWALYKGDEFIGVGNVKELSELTGRTESAILYMTNDAYMRKVEARKKTYNPSFLVEVEDE